ncbi:hypothetical protein TVAG_113610 [Trichomonas vaginalis G3]|uniref:Uncharacterized protein n=1 Tax=Trichomonas vaginalis (strain ATCC PRA-98 / G3) TaxID=412133 RepID=A2DNL4_TRIV3|nr:exportin 4,7-related family [Trichomonas vaginalis G3]EAY18017.1 hypothetical protein TVAG_113610 [Trichomonas vaginalis G3]KAI5524425.1 exportin 4,7-related family [Trichomonas vaginalis G3]|eukprot:XP_001579003.1 hypothetical protein [Trichomonas vaginalis G3]
MNPYDFENWVKNLNSNPQGDVDIETQISEKMQQENIVETLLNFISSDSLSNTAIVFALTMINSKNILDEDEKNLLKAFFSNYFIENRSKFINSAFSNVIARLFIKSYKFSIEEVPGYIQNLANLDLDGLILSYFLGMNIITVNESIAGVEFMFDLACKPLLNNETNPNILQVALEFMSTYLSYCKRGELIYIDKEIMEKIFEFGSINRLFDLIENFQGSIPLYALRIITTTLNTSKSSFGQGDNRDQYIADILLRVSKIFMENKSHPDYLPEYAALCIQLKKLLPSLNPKYDDLGEEFFKAYANPAFFVLTPTILQNYPNLAELVLSFLTEIVKKSDSSIKQRQSFQEAKIIKKSCQQIANTIFNIEFDSNILEPFIEDRSSKILNVILDLHILNEETVYIKNESEKNPEKTTGKYQIVNKVKDSFDLVFNNLGISISSRDCVKSALYLSYLKLCLDHLKSPDLFIAVMETVRNMLFVFPPISAENSSQMAVSLELSIVGFFELLIQVLLSDTDKDRLDFLAENREVVIEFLSRFISEVHDNSICQELEIPIMSILDFSKYKTLPLQVIAMDDNFFSLLMGVDFLLFNEENKNKKARQFFTSLFSLGYLMPDPTHITAMFNTISQIFAESRNPIIFHMLSGSVIAKNCIFDFLLEKLRIQYYELFLSLVKDDKTSDVILENILKFLVVFSENSKRFDVKSLSEEAIFCYTFLTDILRVYAIKVNSMGNSIQTYKIIARILDVLRNIIESNYINLGVLEIYKKTDFRDIVTLVINRLVLVPLSTIADAPKLALRYMKFLTSLLSEIPSLFFSFESEIQHHQIEVAKVILSIDAKEAIDSSISVISSYLSVVDEFNDKDDVPMDLREDLFKFCLHSIIVERNKIESLARVILIFAKTNPELVKLTIDNIFGQIPPELQNESIFPFKHLRSNLNPSIDSSRTSQSKHVLTACLDIGEFFEKHNINIEI